MNKVERIIIGAAVAVGITLGLSACDKPHPAEDAGRSIDQAAEKTAENVNKATTSAGNQGEKAGEAFDDTAITTKVKAAILAEPGLRTLQIGVETVKGAVTLTGSVDVPKNSERAKEIAASVAGVREVNNRLLPKTAG
ncbi:MAG: BON domain-containing protein [Pseudomonadota bacterium]